jgi:hypothetical protein
MSLAAYVVYQVKQTVDGVGFETDMLAVVKHAPFFVSEGEISGMETQFRSYEETERANLYYCLGADFTGESLIPDPRGDERELREKATRHFFEELNAKRIEQWHPKPPKHE